ncbi:hypothetical protein [Salinibacterium sp. ZJ454]|uniref:hypothetical protein n=1 Tax=Salinibacterium sp. ZJ454 TaxID=2708339 RepID=UPI001422F139
MKRDSGKGDGSRFGGQRLGRVDAGQGVVVRILVAGSGKGGADRAGDAAAHDVAVEAFAALGEGDLIWVAGDVGQALEAEAVFDDIHVETDV